MVNYSSIYESSIDYNTYQSTTTGFDGEGQIDSAISYVTSEDLPVLYTLDGHGEKELDSTLQEDIQKANIDIKSLNLITEEKVPDDTACLLINAPTSDISESDHTPRNPHKYAGSAKPGQYDGFPIPFVLSKNPSWNIGYTDC